MCQKCTNWIWSDKLKPHTRCRKCGTWWPSSRAGIGKGKGQGRPANKTYGNGNWPSSQTSDILDKPPGLHRLKPLKKSMPNPTAVELLASTWEVIPTEIQPKLQTLGFGPPPQEEPGLEEILQTNLKELPQAVQDVVNKMQQPIPDTEKALAQKLKAQVTELKTISMKKAQLQTRLDQVKSQYATMLQDTQEHQTKLTEGQEKLKTLSEQYTQAVNKTPPPAELESGDPELPVPMAVETFVASLGIELTAEQRTQLHGLLKRPSPEPEDPSKRRKTDAPIPPAGGQCG